MALRAVLAMRRGAAERAGEEDVGAEVAAVEPGKEIGVFGRTACFFGQKIKPD